MHVSPICGAILVLFVHQLYCDEKVEIGRKNADNIVPSAPHNLTYKKITSSEVYLTWAKPSGVHIQPSHTLPHHEPQLSADHPSKSKILEITSGDILANRDSALIGVLKDTPKHHGYASRLVKSDADSTEDEAFTINGKKYANNVEKYPIEGDVAVPIYEPWRSDRERYFRRRKRRRDAITTTAETPTTIIAKDVTQIVKTGEVPAKSIVDSSDGGIIGVTEKVGGAVVNPVEVSTDFEGQFINYVLFYEEGLPGGVADVWKGGFADNPPQRPAKVKEIVLAHQDGRDGVKGVKFTLRGLKPYSHYRIWVRAYYTDPASLPAVPPATLLSPPSPPLLVLTDVPPPSPPTLRNLSCDQPPGTMQLAWSRPERYARTLDAYVVTLKRVGGGVQKINLDSEEDHIETAISLLVDIVNNMSLYEVTLQAFTKSIVNPKILVNGTETEAYQVTMTPDCIASPMMGGGRTGAGLGAPDDGELISHPELGYMITLLALGVATLLVLLSLYRWGTAFKKCYPMSYLFLEEGGGGEGCGEGGAANKPDVQANLAKKAVSPAHAVVFWGAAEGAVKAGGGLGGSREQLWDPLHPPVLVDRFLAHTAALHQDGDIGFSKEYELIQSKSALLGHTSHHSQHPDNRHKNRYLNITAYDHSRVCLLPSSSCNCDPGKDHRRSCTSKPSPQSSDTSPHCDYVNANFIDGIVAEIDAELAKFIIEQNERRKLAHKKKLDAEATKLEILTRQANLDAKVSQPLLPNNVEGHSLESKIPQGYNTVDPRISLGPFESKIPSCNVKDKLALELNGDRKVTSPGLEILPNTCRLSINLDKKDAEKEKEKAENDTKSDTKSVKESKGKKRSTSADTRDIIIDKKTGSRGHSKNSSVVVNNDSSPLNGVPKIEGAFLNIEFSGIVDSERELQKAREAERLEEANRLAKEAADETLDDLDDLYAQIGGESYRVKSSWLLDRRRYIGTQGPTPGTLPAFWRMVWDHRVAVLVMITNLVERGRRKCDMYWPKEGTESYGAIQVVMLKEDVMATYTVRTFQIKNTKVNLCRPVLQYHYTVWPDHGTPEHPLAVLRFREAARRAAPPQAGAILVHCSAGVGRTGTYIVLDAMLNHLKLTGSLNVFGFLCHVRTQRNFLVQTEEQYVFIHDALLEAIQSGDTEVPAEHAKEYLKRLLEPFPEGHILDGGSLSNKCGLYGAPLSDKKDPLRNSDINGIVANETGRLRNVSTGESDFAMWENDNSARYKDERTLDECRNELVSASLQNSMFNDRNRKDLECNGNRHIDANVVRKVFDEENGNECEKNGDDTVIDCEVEPKYITLDIEKVVANDISPELIIDEMDQKMIDFSDGPLTNALAKNLIAKNDKLQNNLDGKIGDNVSVNSLNLVKSDHSTSYEKLNGTCTKTSEESKASSMSNEDVDLLSNDHNGSGKMDEVNGTAAFGNDNSNTVTSSISSDTNNLNNVANFRDRPNFSPSLGTGNQEGTEVYRRERNSRPKNEENYELLGNSSRMGTVGAMGGNADSCFAGGHRFSCQRRDTSGRKARNLLEHQFKLVTSFEPSKYHTVSACKLANQAKNRRSAVLPVESGRVHLIPKPGVEGSDYINATWLQGHRSLREYVVTQHPLSQTVEDLYRLLWDHSCQILVLLTDTDDQECQPFWPTEENPEINAYTYCIRFVSQEKHLARRKPFDPKSKPSLQKSDAALKQPSPIQSPNSVNSSSIKGFPLKLSRNSQRSNPVSPNEDQIKPDPCFIKSPILMDDKHDTSYYRRQSSTDHQDEERLIPKSDEPPSLECTEETDELRKLNNEPKTDGYTFDRAELRIEVISSNDNSDVSEKTSPNKHLANGDPFSPKDDSKKSQTKSPSKISLKSLRISSPVLKSPTKFKFDFGARISINSKPDSSEHGRKSPISVPKEIPSFEHKFENVTFRDSSQLNCEDMGKDCVITTTHLSMNSLQDDYELKVKLVECPKWLADLDYDENSDTDEESDDDEFEMETKALDYVIGQRLKAYKGVFGLPEFVTRCQEDMKNSPVVVVDKLGGARATALCTLSSALRRNSRDVYSLAKLHHGRRPGVWRRPADIRALYEAIASYQHEEGLL